ncbi:hypothetical protein V2J09_003369 [Rumex salicifolius]
MVKQRIRNWRRNVFKPTVENCLSYGRVYLLVEKSKAFEFFKSFKNAVEKETELSIRCFRKDRGEYTSTSFNHFYKENGIHRQLKNAYTPQHNRVAKWKNKIVMKVVFSLLSMKKIPKTFRAEVVKWTFHVLN